jgi:hypothetical protein
VIVGSAASGSGVFGSWSANGTATTSTGVTKSWPASIAYRSYLVGITYGKYRQQCYSIWQDAWKAWPLGHNGYNDDDSAGPQPVWNFCGTESAGLWTRESSSGSHYSNSVGVKIQGWLGINLSSDSNYETSATLSYYLQARGKMCGSNATPATAAKVRSSR